MADSKQIIVQMIEGISAASEKMPQAVRKCGSSRDAGQCHFRYYRHDTEPVGCGGGTDGADT